MNNCPLESTIPHYMFSYVINFIEKIISWTWGLKQYEKQICGKSFLNHDDNYYFVRFVPDDLRHL